MLLAALIVSLSPPATTAVLPVLQKQVAVQAVPKRDGLEPVGPSGGCNPPLPQPGEVVTWTFFDDPVVICQDTTIPSGAKVRIVDPIDVVVHAGVVLTVNGQLVGSSDPKPMRFTGGGSVLVNGRLAVEGAHVDLDFDAGPRSSIGFSRATVTQGAYVSSTRRDGLTVLEDVVVEQGDLIYFGMAALRGVHVAGPGLFGLQLAGYALADGVTLDGAPLEVTVDFQPRRLSNVDVLNPGGVAAIRATGGGVDPGSNLLIDGDCDLVGAAYPVELAIGGLHPETVLPLTGNARNAIHMGGVATSGGGSGACDWPDLGLPYYVDGDVSVTGRLRVAGGTRFEFEQFEGLLIRGSFFDDTGIIRGRPDAPLMFSQATPGDVHSGAALFNATAEHIVTDGGGLTSSTGFNEIRECTVRNAPVGITGGTTATVNIEGCQLYDNQVGVQDGLTSSQAVIMNGYSRPNVLEGNQTGAINNPSGIGGGLGPFPAEANWWGHPSGPFEPNTNPDGQGDPVSFGVDASPWLMDEPDLSDTPPFVDLHWPFYLAEPGDTIPVVWDAQDDGQIVSQRIRMDVSGGGNFQWITIEDAIDPARRSAFVQIPFIGQTQDARSTLLEVEVLDDAGQVGRHRITLQVPVLNRPDGSVQFNMDLSQGLVPGEEVPVCYDAICTASGSLTAYVVFDTEAHFLQRGTSGSAGLGTCTFSTLRTGKVSTSHARFMLFADGPGNDNDWYFSEPFPMRPPADFPDAPPQVAMLSPLSGQRFQGGDVVPVVWSASDDEGLREFRIQASLNDGRCWSTVATVDGAEVGYDWVLPPLDHPLDQVRIRVVAVDARFQSTAHGQDAVLGFDPN